MKTSKPKTQGRDPQEMRVLLERKAREGLTYPQLSQLTLPITRKWDWTDLIPPPTVRSPST